MVNAEPVFNLNDFDTKTIIEFGEIVYNPADSTVFNGDNKSRLQKKANNVLQYLISHSDRVVTREELIDAVWAGNYYVGDKALSNAIWKIRNAFGSNNKAIETISKQGYRFILTATATATATVTATANTLSGSPQVAKKSLLDKKLFLASMSFATLIVVGILLYSFNQRAIYSNSIKVVEISSLTSDIGQEFFPVISPTGKQVLYITKNNTEQDGIYIKDLESELSGHILLDMQQNIKSPTWSSDGKSIVFSQTSQNGTCKIIKLTIATKKKELLSFCDKNFTSAHSLSYDGKKLAYAEKKGFNDFPGGIFVKELATNEIKQLTFSKGGDFLEFDLNWSPDGRTLAYTKMTSLSSSELFIVKADGNSVQLTFDGKKIRGHTWSPDSQSIVFSINKAGQRGLWKINVTDKKQTALGITGNIFYPNLSRDGRRLVFEKRSIGVNVSSIELTGSVISAQSHSIISSIGRDADADYSSTAEKLVFNSDRSGNTQVWISNFDGSEPKQITSGEDPSLYPAWSKQGDKIAYLKLGKAGQYDQVFVYDLNTDKSSQLSKKLLPHLNPTWAMNGKSIYVSQPGDSEWNLWRHSISDGSSVQLTKMGGVYGKEFFDGKTLYFTKDNQSFIWKLDLESGLEVKVFDTNYKGIQGNWAFSSTGIYFLSRNDIEDNINFYRFSDKSIEKITALPLKSVQNGTFSLANSKLIYTHKSQQQSDIILAAFAKQL